MSKTILVVDDDANVRTILTDYLSEQGFRVVSAVNGQQALFVARDEKPDLILLDIMMPEMNGYEFIRVFSKEKEAPMILLTGQSDRADRVVGLELGADDYVTKPFDLRELLARIRAVLRRAETSAPPPLSHPDERPSREEETKKVDPLAPDRIPEEKTLDLVEGQRGVSFEKLFLPYVKGAKSIKICDPYIRLRYQIYNLMNFCKTLTPPEDGVKLDLVTACDTFQENELRDKLGELKNGLARDHINFDYVFDSNLHDRWIETNTGWRIILGRGLDIFQKPDDKFTLGFVDQTKRKCKATRITYTRW